MSSAVTPDGLSPLESPARRVIVVGSGKGGVGKSTVSLNLAVALAESGHSTGLLDADFYGPNIPLMVGLKRVKWQGDWEIASRNRAPERPRRPPIERHGLKIMSMGFIIAEDQPLILDGQTLSFLMRQLIGEVDWGHLDYLIIDLPPGTADVQQTLLQILPISGAIVVVTPQDVAHLDARKAVRMFQSAGIPLLGAVENMSGFICPHCRQVTDIFSHVPSDRSIWSLDIEHLGAIPLDPELTKSGDSGTPHLLLHPSSAEATAFRDLACKIRDRSDRGGLLDRPTVE